MSIQESVLETMHGDLTNAILDEVRHAKDVWSKLSEEDQHELIDRCQNKAENAIRRISKIVAEKGFESCTAVVDGVMFKDGVKVTMNTFNNSGAHELADRTKQSVLIIFADPSEYFNGEGMPEAEPDQRELEVA